VVALVKAEWRPSIDSEQARHRAGFDETIEIDEQAQNPIGKSMSDGSQADMHNVAEIKARCRLCQLSGGRGLVGHTDHLVVAKTLRAPRLRAPAHALVAAPSRRHNDAAQVFDFG
jgi:hypothetical protein